MSLPADLEQLIEELAEWRRTEVVAQEEVDHTEAMVIAADLQRDDAKRRLGAIADRINALSREIRLAINERTAPTQIIFLTEGDDCP